MIFIDSGPFIARFNKQDPYHQKASRLWQEVIKEKIPLYSSNFILDESCTFLARKTNYHFAAECAMFLFEAEELTILRPDETHEKQALEFFKKYADQKVSFTDCISFALMKAYKIKKAFSFDQHFERAGFVLWT